MRKIISGVSILIVLVLLAGCGETINGIGKDAKRIGGGVRKIFVRES